MKIELWPTLSYIDEDEIKGKTVVVIDVLRATSVITSALKNGAKEVFATIEIEEAMKLKNTESLLGGERKGLKIEGFDLSNSPLEYKKEIVNGKRIIITTTNGTKAIKKSKGASSIYIGSMLNGNAVAKRIADEGKDIIIICSGTYGKFSLDDFICAGKIIYGVSTETEIEMDDFAATSFMAYRDNKHDILSYVKMAKHFRYLASIGYEEDIKYCFTEDITDIVPYYDNGLIKA